LTEYAEKAPEDHIANHRITELVLQVTCDHDQGNLKHDSNESPELEYMAGNSNA